VTTEQLDILDAVNRNPLPWAVDDRDRIHAAWIADDAMHGHVDPNCCRRMLTNDAGDLTVNPRRLAASYSSRLLRRIGYVDSDDTNGRNQGARIGLYTWVGAA
jgi:hypothetical protein